MNASVRPPFPHVLRSPLWDLGFCTLEDLGIDQPENDAALVSLHTATKITTILNRHGLHCSIPRHSSSLRAPYFHRRYGSPQQRWHRDCSGSAQCLLLWSNTYPTRVKWSPADNYASSPHRWHSTLAELGARRFKRDNYLVRDEEVPLTEGHMYLINNRLFEHTAPVVPNHVDRWFIRVNLFPSD